MKGEFTRGHNPDRKRRRYYRRVLLQQGRLLLDSDVNALVDAHDALLRGVTADLGCPAGSPDLGYLITPGRLLALFDELGHVTAGSPGLEVYRDYRYKFAGRYPALYAGNPTAAAGSVTIRLRHESNGAIDLWVRSDGTNTIHIPGVADVIANAPHFVAHTRTPAATQDLPITLDPGEEIWIGLIEERQAAGTVPRLWAAAGRFHVAGLVVENPADGAYPDVSFGPAPGPALPDLVVNDAAGPRPLQAGDRVVAFLEAWERHITFVEDRGILEEALGGRVDTCTRTQAVGQVKLAPAYGLTPAQLRSAIRRPAGINGQLNVTTAPVAHDPDPCALPVSGGYTGSENRLYRFEVHRGGPLAGSLLKWSRDNGAELFAAAEMTATTLSFSRDTPLRDGDLVEVLSEAADLRDQAPASLDPVATTFTPPERAVGVLARLRGVAPAAGAAGKTFELRDPADDDLPVPALTGPLGDPLPPLKVRRWHGLIQPAGAAPFEVESENGIRLSLTGTFRAGDFWQYEARVRRDNSNGPFPPDPHGPERLFAPLALLEYQGADSPLRLVEWLDDRFPPLCELTADDIAFDGSRLGEESDTVQEIIEELIERHGGGCCDHVLAPRDGGDDAAALAEVLAGSTGDVVICLRPGIYHFADPVKISARRVTIRGCPDALIVAPPEEPAFQVGADGRLVLEDLTLFAPPGTGGGRLVDVDDGARALEARAVGFLMAQPDANQVAIRVANADPRPADPATPGASMGDPGGAPDDAPDVSLHECVVHGGWVLSAPAVGGLALRDCACYCLEGGVTARWVLRPDVSGTTIVAGVDPALSGAWDADQLRTAGAAVLEGLAGAAPVNPGNVALGAALLGPGKVEDCQFVALIGIAANRAGGVRFRGNRYSVRRIGFSAEELESVAIESEQIEARGADRMAGLHVGQRAEQLRLTNCEIRDMGTGILLAADLAPTAVSPSIARRCRMVYVAGNQLSNCTRGLQLGGGFGPAFNGDVEDVTLQANQVLANEVGLQLNAPAVALPSFGSGILISENFVSAPQAVVVAGSRLEIGGNRLRVVSRAGIEALGIVAQQTSHVVIENNQIEYVEALDSAAIMLEGGQDARVAGNVVRAVGVEHHVYMRASSHPRLQVVNNRFGSADCDVSGGSALLFRANELGRLRVSGVVSGSVTENRFQEAAHLVPIGGSWQVMDNDAAAALVIQPRTEGRRIGFPFRDLFLNPELSGKYLVVLEVIGTLAGSRLRPLGPLPPPGGGGPAPGPGGPSPVEGEVAPRASPAGGLFAPVTSSEAVGYVVDNPNWASDWEDVIVADITGRFEGVLDDAIIRDPDIIIVPLERREAAYHAQVVGNWCHEGSLIVGAANAPIAVEPHPDSVLQVVANRVDGSLLVNQYRLIVIAHNVANALSAWIVSGAGPVNEGNLNK